MPRSDRSGDDRWRFICRMIQTAGRKRTGRAFQCISGLFRRRREGVIRLVKVLQQRFALDGVGRLDGEADRLVAKLRISQADGNKVIAGEDREKQDRLRRLVMQGPKQELGHSGRCGAAIRAAVGADPGLALKLRKRPDQPMLELLAVSGEGCLRQWQLAAAEADQFDVQFATWIESRLKMGTDDRSQIFGSRGEDQMSIAQDDRRVGEIG